MKKYLKQIFQDKIKYWLTATAGFVLFIICSTFLKPSNQPNYIVRPYVDEDDTEVKIEVEGLLEGSQKIEIPVSKRVYSQEEAKESIKKGMDEILKILPGENTSLQNITNNLNPVSELSDLGLSVKWATCNLGTSAPQYFGSFVSWGSTWSETPEFDWTFYPHTVSKTWITKYCTDPDMGYSPTKGEKGFADNKTTLEAKDDVATVRLGSPWRMPTQAEFQELVDKCKWTWTILKGTAGYKVVSKKNGKSIFLPAAGYHLEIDHCDVFESGAYWTSSLSKRNNLEAFALYFSKDGYRVFPCERFVGYYIRPVRK